MVRLERDGRVTRSGHQHRGAERIHDDHRRRLANLHAGSRCGRRGRDEVTTLTDAPSPPLVITDEPGAGPHLPVRKLAMVADAQDTDGTVTSAFYSNDAAGT